MLKGNLGLPKLTNYMKYGFLVNDTAGHYRAIGDLVNMAP